MADPLWTIDKTLKAQGFTFLGPPMRYRGPIKVHGVEVTVDIDVPDPRFAQLPTVNLHDRSKLAPKDLAHLVDGGSICYDSGNGLILDLYNPGGSVLRVLAQASTALERSFGGRAASEFERELASYWSDMPMSIAVAWPDGPAIVDAELLEFQDHRPFGFIVVPKGWKGPRPKMREPAKLIFCAAPLRFDDGFPARDLAAVLAYAGRARGLPAGWREAMLATAAAGDMVFLIAENAIIGWAPKFSPELRIARSRKDGFRPQFFRKLMESRLTEVEISRASGHRSDLPFCIQRNLDGRPSLAGRKISLIGCGTIGGYLGHMLVQNGAGCDAMFTVYDIDDLKPGNLGRHILRFGDLGRPKASGLAEFLQGFHPQVQVQGKAVDATTDWTFLAGQDLIIDATGEANVTTALNHQLCASAPPGKTPPLLHAWVWGNGVAAQSFLNLSDGHACYRCLKTDFDGEWRHNPLRDPKSPLRRAPASCGEGEYVPFAVDAPIAAAQLALGAALDWVGGTPGHRLRTQILNHKEGRDKLDWATPPRLKDCAACGG